MFYRQLACALLDYLATCNKHNAVPLRWDLNLYTAKLHDIDRKANWPGGEGAAMIVYVIGPVTGIEADNRPAFEAAAEELCDAGYTALIPHWFVVKGTDWNKAMRRSIEALVKCDGVAVLDGWARSEGARIEADLASALDMPIKTVEGWTA